MREVVIQLTVCVEKYAVMISRKPASQCFTASSKRRSFPDYLIQEHLLPKNLIHQRPDHVRDGGAVLDVNYICALTTITLVHVDG
jgi:hypothetical protein